jgi:hypothetical protein
LASKIAEISSSAQTLFERRHISPDSAWCLEYEFKKNHSNRLVGGRERRDWRVSDQKGPLMTENSRFSKRGRWAEAFWSRREFALAQTNLELGMEIWAQTNENKNKNTIETFLINCLQNEIVQLLMKARFCVWLLNAMFFGLCRSMFSYPISWHFMKPSHLKKFQPKCKVARLVLLHQAHKWVMTSSSNNVSSERLWRSVWLNMK